MSLKVTYSQLINVFGINKFTDSTLEKLFLNMLELDEKLNNIDEQSWAFKKGIENSKKRIIEYRSKINNIRRDFNNSEVDDLIYSLKEENEKIEATKNWTGSNFNRALVRSSARSNIAYINMLLDIKSRINYFESIDFYVYNKDELIKLLGW